MPLWGQGATRPDRQQSPRIVHNWWCPSLPLGFHTQSWSASSTTVERGVAADPGGEIQQAGCPQPPRWPPWRLIRWSLPAFPSLVLPLLPFPAAPMHLRRRLCSSRGQPQHSSKENGTSTAPPPPSPLSWWPSLAGHCKLSSPACRRGSCPTMTPYSPLPSRGGPEMASRPMPTLGTHAATGYQSGAMGGGGDTSRP